MAHAFAPPPGTRFPRRADDGVNFEATGPLRGKLTFDQILEYHKPTSEEYTLFRIFRRQVAGAACFGLDEEDVRIDYLTRNDLFSVQGVSVGAVLVSAVEFLAGGAGRERIRLESMSDPDLMRWYRSRGFTEEGRSWSDPHWGELHPMVKRVEPLRFDGP
jgi:hypothetical protein